MQGMKLKRVVTDLGTPSITKVDLVFNIIFKLIVIDKDRCFMRIIDSNKQCLVTNFVIYS